MLLIWKPARREETMKIDKLHLIITNPFTILVGALLLFWLMKHGIDVHGPFDLAATSFI
jgi:hypothetical protein